MRTHPPEHPLKYMPPSPRPSLYGARLFGVRLDVGSPRRLQNWRWLPRGAVKVG